MSELYGGGRQARAGRKLLSCLMRGANTSGAQVEAFSPTIYYKSNRMDVRHPTAISMTFGMTHIMTKLWCFPT